MGCTPEERKKLAEELIEDFREDVIDTVNELASLSYGSFASTVFTLAAQLTAGTAANYAAFLGTSIVRNNVGSLISMVGFSLSILNGSKMMLKYLAAKTLKDRLQTRIHFSRSLNTEINQLIGILIAFRDMNLDTDSAFLAEVERSLRHVKRATAMVGGEYGKIQNPQAFSLTKNPVDPKRLQRSIDEIDQAIIYLGGQNLAIPNYTNLLNNLNRKYSLKVVPESTFVNEIGVVKP